MAESILIVEDEPLIAEDLAIMLKKAGYTVVGPAYEGLSALDIIHNQSPDLVLLDISLETSMSGLEVAKKVNETSKTPFIFITSYADEATLENAQKLLPYGYIVKPFKKKDVLAAIQITLFRVNNLNSQNSPFNTLEEINQKLPTDMLITPKEYDVIFDVVKGLSNEEVAKKHFISIHTVKTHLKRAFVKLNIKSRTQLTSILIR